MGLDLVMPSGVYERSAELRATIALREKGRPKPQSGRKHDAHSHWRGEEATYSSKHKWVRRHKGRAAEQMCAHCERPARAWANVSHEYRRDLSDYVALCWPCHAKFDGYPNGWNQPKVRS